MGLLDFWHKIKATTLTNQDNYRYNEDEVYNYHSGGVCFVPCEIGKNNKHFKAYFDYYLPEDKHACEGELKWVDCFDEYSVYACERHASYYQ